MKYAEVIIVGGGPAGSTCAWKLKQQKVDCLLLDAKQFPRTKLCAGWIVPEVIEQLELDDYPGLQENENWVTFFGKDIRLKRPSYVVRRYEFDDWLLKRSGVTVYQHKVHHIEKEGGFYIIDNEYKCKYLVGAGGAHCPVYISLFKQLHPRNKKNEVCCLEQEIKYDHEVKATHSWFYENDVQGYSWCVSKNDGYLNIGVGALFKGEKANIKEHWDLHVKRLAELNMVSDYDFKPRGYTYYTRDRVDNCRIDNAFLIGDAAGLATKDLGEGISAAVESGFCAADSIINGVPFSLHSIHQRTAPTTMRIAHFLWRLFNFLGIKRLSKPTSIAAKIEEQESVEI